ncbi:MAG: ABC transporter permease [Candidatus Woesearchaeota archaeon]
MLLDYFSLAFKSLRNRKIRSWLTMIGIFIGIAAVVSLISLGAGLKGAVLSQFSSAGSDKLVVQASGIQFGPPGSGVVTPLTERDAEAIRRVTGVRMVAERLIRVSTMEYRGKKIFAYLSDIPTDKSRDLVVQSMHLELASGRLLSVNDKNKILVGYDYATKKIFSKYLAAGDKVLINGQQFEIVGILKKLGTFGGGQLVLMNDKVLRDTLSIGDEIDIMAVQVDQSLNIDKISEDVKKTLRTSRNVKKGKEDFTVQTPTQSVQSLESILSYAQWFLVGIAFISIVVGGVGIMNTMYTAVLERRKEIGIMKSVGAKNSQVFQLFFIESGLIGMLGGMIGVILGIFLSQIIVMVMGWMLGSGVLKAEYSPWLIIGALAFSFVVGTAAGTLPASQAAKLHPVDALRK